MPENISFRTVVPRSPQDVLENPPEGWEELFKTARSDLEFTLGRVKAPPKLLHRIFYTLERLHPLSMKALLVMDENPTTMQNGYGWASCICQDNDILQEQLNREKLVHFDPDVCLEQGIGFWALSMTPNSHPLWESFFIHLLRFLNKVNPKTVIILWGDRLKRRMEQHCRKQKRVIAPSPKMWKREKREFIAEVEDALKDQIPQIQWS